MPKPVQNPDGKSWFTITNATPYSTNAEEKRVIVNIHGYIGMWDITAANLMTQINGIEDMEIIEVHINSYGGEVFEGVAIYNWLRSHKARVETVIDSVAASIASLIFLAGEKRTVYDTSMGMVHLPIGMSYGNSKQMRKDADDLDKIDEGTIRKAYRKAVGDKMSDEEIDELMQNETWLDSDELVEYGFATEKRDTEDSEDETTDKLRMAAGAITDFSQFGFERVPERINAIFPKVKKTPKLVTVPINSAPLKPENNNPKEGIMPIENKNQVQVEQPDVEKIREASAKQERLRITNIRAAAAAMEVTGDVVDKLIEDGKTIDMAIPELTAAKKLRQEQPENPQAIQPDVRLGADDADKFRAGAVAGICITAGLPVADKERESVKASETPRTLHSLLRACMIRAGKSANKVMNLSAFELARDGLSGVKNAFGTGTGDLTNILADTINKAIGVGYSNAMTTWASWAKVMPVSDFKTFSLNKLSVFGDMETIAEGQPFTQGALSDKKESGSVTVRGKSLNIPMQVFVNDDMSALVRIPTLMGNAWNFSQNKNFYDTLYGSGTGPTMEEADSNGTYTCFNSYRANYASGAGAPSVTTLSTARAAMRNQSAPKGKASDTAQRLNLVPRFIVVGTTLETTVEQLLLTRTDVATAGSLAYNPFAQGGSTPIQIVVDAYLDSLTTTGWYLIADQNQIESMIMLALNGQAAPTVRSEDSRVGEALGVNYDVYGAYGIMCGDYRGMYFHAGA